MRLIARLLSVIAAAGFAAAAAAQDYAPDWSFNAGQYYADTFAGSPENYYRGQRIVRLPDGDVVVAAMVPRRDGQAYALGLVRYSDSGVRRSWANPGSFGVSGNTHIIYDPVSTPLRAVVNVQDLQLWGDRLFVLLDVGLGPQLPLDEPGLSYVSSAIDVVVFRTDGAWQSATPIRQSAAAPAAQSFRAGGIELFVPDPLASPPQLHLAYGGTGLYSGEARAEYARYSVSAGSVITNLLPAVTPNPGNRCNSSQDCEIRAIALGGRPGPRLPPRVYLGGWHHTADGATDFLLLGLASDTGSARIGFGSDLSGGATVNFPFSDIPVDTGRVLSVLVGSGSSNEDQIFLAGEITARCSNGAAVVKFLASGIPDTGFGSEGNGTVRWYPPDAAPEQPSCALPNSLIRLRGGMVVADGRIAVAAQRERGPASPGMENDYDGLLTLVDPDSGAIVSNSLIRYEEAGVRKRHSAFSDLVAAGPGRYVATGNTRFRHSDASLPPLQRGKWQAASVGLSPDRLFADGFQLP